MSDVLNTAKQSDKMLRAFAKTMDAHRIKNEKAEKAVRRLIKAEKDLIKEEESVDISMERRTKALTEATKTMNKMGKAFELLSIQSLAAYREANDGANIFEYLDLALSNTSEQVKIFGLEASNARKIMYGFLPPGMFRLVNKLSTGFRTLGAIRRKYLEAKKGDGETNPNMIVKVLSLTGKLFAKRKAATKEELNITKKLSKAKTKILDFATLGGHSKQKASDKGTGPLTPKTMFRNMQKRELKAAQAKVSRVKAIYKLEQNNLKDLTKQKLASENRVKKEIEEASKKIQKEHRNIAKEASKRASMLMPRDPHDVNYDIDARAELERKLKEKMLNESAKNENSIINKTFQKKLKLEKELQDTKEFYQPMMDEQSQKVKEARTKDSVGRDSFKRFGKMQEEQKSAFKKEEKARKFIEVKEKIKEKFNKQTAKARNLWTNSLKPLLANAGSFFLSFMLFAATVVAGLIVLQALWPKIQSALEPAFAVIMEGFTLIWEGVGVFFGGIFDLFDAIMNGGFMDIMLALWEIVKGFGMIVWGLIKVLLGGLVVFLYEMALGLWDKAKNWVTSLGNDLKSVGKIAGLIFAIAGMMIAWMYGAPILLIVGIGILLYKFGKWVVGAIGFANGGTVNTNMQIVGEKGPELVSLPKGSRVHSNKDSKSMASGSGGVTNNFNITINAKDTSDGELRRIAEKVGQMVNSKINRSTSASTMR